MAKQLHTTIRGLANASLKTPSGKVLVLPTAAGSVFNPGQEIQLIEGSSNLGEMVILDTYIMSRKPEVKLDWKQKNIQLIGMQLGLEFQQSSNVDTKVFQNGFLVTKNEYPAADSGYEGYGMTEDQTGSIASLLNTNDLSESLTRQEFASFSAATPKSFAQGANGATKWSDDLIGKYVAYEFPHTLSSAIKLTENDFNSFELNMMTILTDRSLLHWRFPSASVKVDEGEINMVEPEMSIGFRIQDDGSSCLPYAVVYKGQAQRRRCA